MQAVSSQIVHETKTDRILTGEATTDSESAALVTVTAGADATASMEVTGTATESEVCTDVNAKNVAELLARPGANVATAYAAVVIREKVRIGFKLLVKHATETTIASQAKVVKVEGGATVKQANNP